MYDPKGNGKDKTTDAVLFDEVRPPDHLARIVHRFLDLRTDGILTKDYRFHALPDACIYIVFDQMHPQVTGVSQLRVQSEEFNLGRQFHFVNIRLMPGVWVGDPQAIIAGLVDAPYTGDLPLLKAGRALAGQSFADQQTVLIRLVEWLIAQGCLAPNPMTEKIFQHLDSIHNVADIAEICAVSPRQLQRTLKRTTGFSPHDFLKVLRLQQTLNGGDIWSYADQSHFIHSFRKATGYTPGKYARKFDV